MIQTESTFVTVNVRFLNHTEAGNTCTKKATK